MPTIPAIVRKTVQRLGNGPFLDWLETTLGTILAGAPALEVDAALTVTAASLFGDAFSYDNGTAGVGATLEGDSNGAFPTADGVVAALNNVYLFTAQAAEAQNGAWKLTQLGDGSNPPILTRSTAFDSSAEMKDGTIFGVRAGTVNGDTTWKYIGPDAPTVGSTSLTFERDSKVVTTNTAQTISGLKTLTAAPVFGAGLTASGAVANDFSGGTGTFKTSSGANTLSGDTTLAAGKDLTGAAGDGALILGSMTGDTALPTGATSWAGASGKALSLVSTAAAVTLKSTTSGTVVVDSGGALQVGNTAATSLAIGNSSAIATFSSKRAAGAVTNLIADPGTGQAIPVTADGVCAITVGSAGAETNTVAAPTYIGQRLTICGDVNGSGTRVITLTGNTTILDGTNNTITISAIGQALTMQCIQVGGAKKWSLVVNRGTALSFA